MQDNKNVINERALAELDREFEKVKAEVLQEGTTAHIRKESKADYLARVKEQYLEERRRCLAWMQPCSSVQ